MNKRLLGYKGKLTFPSFVNTYMLPHSDTTARTPSTNVPEYAMNLFSRSKMVTFDTSVLSGSWFFATKFLTVAEFVAADGKNGGETMMR